MNRKQFLERIRSAAGLASDAEAVPAASAVLSVLAGAMSWADAQKLANHLPDPFASSVRQSVNRPSLSRFAQPGQVGLAVARALGWKDADGGRGEALFQAVIGVVAEVLDRDGIDALRRELPLWGAILR